jgi:hypothetical protein
MPKLELLLLSFGLVAITAMARIADVHEKRQKQRESKHRRRP